MRSTLPYWLALMIALGGSYAGLKWWQVRQFESERQLAVLEAANAPKLSSFELVERSGAAFRSTDLAGRVWVGSFFFTTCPGTCAMLNGNIKKLQDDPELQEVSWVSISVDPANDDVAALAKYADAFDADPDRWLFCRGDLDYVKRIGADIFGQSVSFKGHSDYGVLIDREGRKRGAFNINDPAQNAALKKQLLACLAEARDDQDPGNEPEATSSR